jgi:putative colanic acid biosynthesis acetyltransferase WcaF
MNLAQFSAREFDRGAGRIKEGLWLVCRALAFAYVNPFNSVRTAVLRLFGARIGSGVIIKPGVKIKFPWRLDVGDHSWIGEDVWIDNLDWVRIGSNSCVSQGTYLCTGNHDWSKDAFDLKTGAIHIGREVWITARCVLGPGVSIGDRSIVSLGTTVRQSVPANSICASVQAEVTVIARNSMKAE